MMSTYLDRATAEARKVRGAVGAATEHGQKAAEEALGAFTKAAERARDTLEALLVQAKPYVRQAKPYLRDANAYFDKSRRRMSGRGMQPPVFLAVASIGAVVLLALLLAPGHPKADGEPDQPSA